MGCPLPASLAKPTSHRRSRVIFAFPSLPLLDPLSPHGRTHLWTPVYWPDFSGDPLARSIHRIGSALCTRTPARACACVNSRVGPNCPNLFSTANVPRSPADLIGDIRPWDSDAERHARYSLENFFFY